jgi:hypothetical protein
MMSDVLLKGGCSRLKQGGDTRWRRGGGSGAAVGRRLPIGNGPRPVGAGGVWRA